MINNPVYVTPEELAQQEAAMERIAALPNRPETYHIVTYGCQMNAHDSETLAGMRFPCAFLGCCSQGTNCYTRPARRMIRWKT